MFKTREVNLYEWKPLLSDSITVFFYLTTKQKTKYKQQERQNHHQRRPPRRTGWAAICRLHLPARRARFFPLKNVTLNFLATADMTAHTVPSSWCWITARFHSISVLIIWLGNSLVFDTSNKRVCVFFSQENPYNLKTFKQAKSTQEKRCVV